MRLHLHHIARRAALLHIARRAALVVLAIALTAPPSQAQQYKGPLTVDGLHQHQVHSARARAFGGVTITAQGDVGLMFRNPAALQFLDGIQISIAGMRQYQDLDQDQLFAPVRYYPNLSLLLENRTDPIPDPDPDLIGFTPADTVQRPFDDIQPNWSRSNTNDLPLHALAAIPIDLGDVTLTAGLGAVTYANLDYYYQNNNVLAPAVLEHRPLPVLRPTDDNPVTADWYQSIRSREGTMYGYGAALAGHIEPYNLTIALSGMRLDGSTDDYEQLQGRGTLTFLANEFRADSSFDSVTKVGTSDFSGFELTIGTALTGQYVSVGAFAKPPTTFTRSFNMSVEGDTSGTPISYPLDGEDEFQLPWRGSVGLVLRPSENLNVGLQYEFRPYSSATFTDASGNESSPWESASLFRIGVDYGLAPWLDLRGGIRGEADVFVPDGSPIDTDPVVYRVYSFGFGLNFSGLQWDIAYERADMRYQDIWGSAVSNNSEMRHVIVTDISYTLPFRQ